MSKTANEVLATLERGQEQGRAALEKIFAATQPGVVYSQPVQVGEYTIITASEVVAGGGFGFGAGGGSGPAMGAARAPSEAETPAEGEARQGGGGGAGGGGWSMARPVGAIVVGPDGVRYRPIVDVTKIVLAFVTAWGAMAITLRRLRGAGRR